MRVRIYDVEPREDRPDLPGWATSTTGYESVVVPEIGHELKIEDAHWRVIRVTHVITPQAQLIVLGVRFIS